MMTRLQAKYAAEPVKFVLVPCNQFGQQEPGANSEVKVFAESQGVSVATAGKGSNVIMLAKSNLNHEACTASGEDACTSASKECCPENDPIYEYLQAETGETPIKWNFDKIITGKDGKPFADEVPLHGGDVDAQVSAIVDRLLAESKTTSRTTAETLYLAAYPEGPWRPRTHDYAKFLGISMLLFSWTLASRVFRVGAAPASDDGGQYYLVA